MPQGIIMASSSVGATQEAIEKVLKANGHEPAVPEAARAAEPAEPKREDFETDEAFEEAQEAHAVKQEEAEEREEEEAHPEKPAARRPTRKERAVAAATKKLQEENRKLADRLAALEGKKQPEPVKVEEPKREQFKTDKEFEDAQFDYRYKLRRQKEDLEAAQKAVNDRLKENLENYQSQVADFKETVDDWDEVVNQPIPIHESVYLAIQEQENGAAVTYHLGKHPDYARRLAELTPLSAVMEIGRLAARLSKSPQSKPSTQTGDKPKPKAKIPAPVEPVRSSAAASTLTSREAAQKRDFRAFKAAQRRGI